MPRSDTTSKAAETLAKFEDHLAELSRLRSLCRRAADTVEAEGDSDSVGEFVAELRLAGGEEK